MVWGLFPVDPIPGEEKYYIFNKGTYKVGRKGCDIIITKDKVVSRIHAEILVDEMTSSHNRHKKTSNASSNIRVRDCSKYGTFINKNSSIEVKVQEFPNKETFMRDGDLVSFGTGCSTYKFSFVPLVFLIQSMEPLDQFLDRISSIGASVTKKWSPDCTHVIVEELIPLTENILDAVLARKPFASFSWVELIAATTICTEIPSCCSYTPALTIEGTSVKIADPQSREHCLRGYTFLLESTLKYKFRVKFQSLLEVGGAKVVSQETYCQNSQVAEDEGNKVVRVIPADFTRRSECPRNLSSLPIVTEVDLISAVFSGYLDPSAISKPPVQVTSSCSTDETVVADSDTEVETASSVPPYIVVESAEEDIQAEHNHVIGFVGDDSREEETGIHLMKSTEYVGKQEIAVKTVESIRDEGKVEVHTVIPSVKWSEGRHERVIRDAHDMKAEEALKPEESEIHSGDIIYSHDLIVRDRSVPASMPTLDNGSKINFKRFRKKGTPSGNSFTNLIPFSRNPYKASDYGSEEVAESVKEERKRKQMEAVAEELFNNDKGKRRGALGSLHGILSRK